MAKLGQQSSEKQVAVSKLQKLSRKKQKVETEFRHTRETAKVKFHETRTAEKYSRHKKPIKKILDRIGPHRTTKIIKNYQITNETAANFCSFADTNKVTLFKKSSDEMAIAVGLESGWMPQMFYAWCFSRTKSSPKCFEIICYPQVD